MVTEHDKTLEALRIAIEMENDGRECYLQASEGSSNEVGKELLKSLAAEEDTHRRKFEEIYNAIREKEGWPETGFQPDKGERLRALFAKTCEMIGVNIKGVASDLDAIKTAIDKENKSYDFYGRQSKNATYNAEREFYKILAGEEREHGLILLDYYEYLTDPAGWFVKKEHPSLDGG
jgi:rubrerythrin